MINGVTIRCPSHKHKQHCGSTKKKQSQRETNALVLNIETPKTFTKGSLSVPLLFEAGLGKTTKFSHPSGLHISSALLHTHLAGPVPLHTPPFSQTTLPVITRTLFSAYRTHPCECKAPAHFSSRQIYSTFLQCREEGQCIPSPLTLVQSTLGPPWTTLLSNNPLYSFSFFMGAVPSQRCS